MSQSPSITSSSPSLSEALMEEDPDVGDFFKSIWNHFVFGWTVTLAPRIIPGVPITFLGRNYLSFSNSLFKNHESGDKKAFEADFYTRLWFTYRDSFQPLPIVTNPPVSSLETAEGNLLNTSADLRPLLRELEEFFSESASTLSPSTLKIPLSIRTSDCGWGCMIRSVQMLAAQALLIHFLGRDWIYDPGACVSTQDPSTRMHRRIIRFFADTPLSPLSIHRLIQASGCRPGTHFGPAAVCRALLIAMAWTDDEDLKQIAVYLVCDRIIFRETALALIDGGSRTSSMSMNHQPSASNDVSRTNVPHNSIPTTSNFGIDESKRESARKRGLLFLLPMRLGAGNRIDQSFIPTLLQLLRDPACVGLIGGRPKHSIYAPAVQSDHIFYLDPHFNQPTVNVTDNPNFDVSSWHCSSPQKMTVRALDPSLALGFYCGSREEVLGLLERLPSDSKLAPNSPTSPTHQLIEVAIGSEEARLRRRKPQPALYPQVDGDGDKLVDSQDEDDADTCLVDL
ncbi:hypothetical protein Aperf_G00000103022 [Anoplocephala perfoliata]